MQQIKRRPSSTPCKRGHSSGRYTNGNCIQCALDREGGKRADPQAYAVIKERERTRYLLNRTERIAAQRASYEQNRAKLNKDRRERYATDPKPAKQAATKWRMAHPEKALACNRRYEQEHHEQRVVAARQHNKKHRELHPELPQARSRAHYLQYRAAYTEKKRRREARKQQASPAWADIWLMQQMYKEAKQQEQNTGVRMSVDHIVPLRGLLQGKHVVCGLHCEANLQVMSLRDNKSKGHRWWPDMPEMP